MGLVASYADKWGVAPTTLGKGLDSPESATACPLTFDGQPGNCPGPRGRAIYHEIVV